jgi:hypothetical protein
LENQIRNSLVASFNQRRLQRGLRRAANDRHGEPRFRSRPQQ